MIFEGDVLHVFFEVCVARCNACCYFCCVEMVGGCALISGGGACILTAQGSKGCSPPASRGAALSRREEPGKFWGFGGQESRLSVLKNAPASPVALRGIM